MKPLTPQQPLSTWHKGQSRAMKPTANITKHLLRQTLSYEMMTINIKLKTYLLILHLVRSIAPPYTCRAYCLSRKTYIQQILFSNTGKFFTILIIKNLQGFPNVLRSWIIRPLPISAVLSYLWVHQYNSFIYISHAVLPPATAPLCKLPLLTWIPYHDLFSTL